jgi:hypothetical protein
MGQRNPIPRAGLVAAAKGQTGVTDGPQGRGIIAAVLGSSTLDQPFEAIQGASDLGVRARSFGLASQAKGLGKPEPGVAIVGVRLKRSSEIANRQWCITPAQRQAAVKSGQRRMGAGINIIAQEGFGLVLVTAVEGNFGPSAPDLGSRLRERAECPIRLIKVAEPPQALRQGKPR